MAAVNDMAQYQGLFSRYANFQRTLDKPDVEPPTVYLPLTKKQLEELELIREVSLDLQKEKEEHKAAQLAKQQAAEEEPAPEKKEDAPEAETKENTE